MARSEPIDFRIDDLLRLRKQHPCGSYDWKVTRLGADIGLRCQKCGRHILLERITLEKRLRAFLVRGPE
jgi:hypothetical protein